MRGCFCQKCDAEIRLYTEGAQIMPCPRCGALNVIPEGVGSVTLLEFDTGKDGASVRATPAPDLSGYYERIRREALGG